MTKRMPAGTITTRADGAQWQKPASPDAHEWKQVRDGDNTPQSRAIRDRDPGARSESEPYALLRAKYDLDGVAPPDELHPDHVGVDTEGDIDGKPVLSWQHEGQQQRSYTSNFHHRKHRHTFAALQSVRDKLDAAPGRLRELAQKATGRAKDRYSAARAVVEFGLSTDQALGVTVGQVGKPSAKGAQVLVSHPSGRPFYWDAPLDLVSVELDGVAPTMPLYACTPECVDSALAEVGLEGVPPAALRAHAMTVLASDMLSKRKRTKVDSYGAGTAQVAAAIKEVSVELAKRFGHAPPPEGMSYVPPHVQAAYLAQCGGDKHYKQTYAALTMRKAVQTEQEEELWQSALATVMKSYPSSKPKAELPKAVRTLYETMLGTAPSPRSSTRPSKTSHLSKTTPPQTRMTEEKKTEPAQETPTQETPTQETPKESTPSLESQPPSTPPRTQGTESSPLTQSSASQGSPLTSSWGLTASETTSPTEEPSSTTPACPTTGPSPESLSSLTPPTPSPKQATSTPSSLYSEERARTDAVASVMASLIRKHAEGILDESGLTYFTGMLDQVDTSRGQLAFLAEASAFAAIVKSGSVAGTRGDPVGVVATHNDGSRWRKVGIGKWARVGADQKQKSPDNQKPKDVDSVRVTALRARLKQLKREWHAASSASQRADVVGKLRAVKAAIRKMSGRARVKKSEVPDILPFADKVFANILEELEVCGEVRYVPDHVVASLRRNLHRHRRDLCNTDPILAEVMRDIAAGLPVDSDAVRELGYVAKSSLEVLSGVGGPDFAEWAKSTVPAATMKQSDIADTVRNMHQLTVSMKSIDHYVEDTNEFDPLGRLTAGDYIARIHKDGGTAARDLFTARMVKGAEFVADHITQKLEELR